MLYKVTFLNHKKRMVEAIEPNDNPLKLSKKDIEKRMYNPSINLTEEEYNVVDQLLAIFPDATNIKIEEYISKEPNNNQSGGIIIVAIFVGVIIAPIIMTFAMFGKLLFSSYFEDILEVRTFKKFRTIYLIAGYLWTAISITLIALAISKTLQAGIYMPFIMLTIGNSTYVIVGLFVGSKITKYESDSSESLKKRGARLTTITLIASISVTIVAPTLFVIMSLPHVESDSSPIKDFEYELYEEWSEAVILEYKGNDSKVIIPDKINGCDVVSIEHNAFLNKTGLYEISIPSSMCYVSLDAFSGCNNLQFNEYNNAYYLGNDQNPYLFLYKAITNDITECTTHPSTCTINSCAFMDCTSLEIVNITEGVNNLGSSAFEGCFSLTSVSIPNSIVYLGEDVFLGCDSLSHNRLDGLYYLGSYDNPYLLLAGYDDGDKRTNYVINDRCRFIGEYAFEDNEALTFITIPEGITYLSDYMFSWCTSLTSIIIPDNITDIGEGVFSNCKSLISVTFSKNTEYIVCYSLFEGCSNLTSISFNGTIEEWKNVVLIGTLPLDTIHCNDGDYIINYKI